jgi:4-amino-4-deoxy-L-arabinose transferase-like glycosyltransferase
MPLPSSFWVDEMETVFVAEHGSHHPSLRVAPHAWNSPLYYRVAHASQMIFGSSEIAYRLPSLFAMGLALFLIARLAARLIHPQAAWFALFGCFALRGIADQADDARPYALGTAVAAAAVWFLVRWLDGARWRDASLFVLCAALLWRVHLIYWPFYLVFLLYVLVRLFRGESQVGWLRATLIFAVLGLLLTPVAWDALALYRQAREHVIVEQPSLRDLTMALKFGLVLLCGVGALLFALLTRGPRQASRRASASSATLLLAWWLCQPLVLFAFSRITGNSVFVSRYLYIALPGAALAATLAAGYFIPPNRWKLPSIVLACGVLLFLGQWRQPWPSHHPSDWRSAALAVRSLSTDPATPILCPSPFIEAKAPVWRPDYALPGFLYCHLSVYPVGGKPFLLPFEMSPEAEQYVHSLFGTLNTRPRFLVYGWDRQVWSWGEWLSAQPELAGWHQRRLGPFGDVEVILFENSARPTL